MKNLETVGRVKIKIKTIVVWGFVYIVFVGTLRVTALQWFRLMQMPVVLGVPPKSRRWLLIKNGMRKYVIDGVTFYSHYVKRSRVAVAYVLGLAATCGMWTFIFIRFANLYA